MSIVAEIASIDHLVARALELGIDQAHAPPDFVYLLLARERGVKLVTADAKFIAKLSGSSFANDVFDPTV